MKQWKAENEEAKIIAEAINESEANQNWTNVVLPTGFIEKQWLYEENEGKCQDCKQERGFNQLKVYQYKSNLRNTTQSISNLRLICENCEYDSNTLVPY